MSEPIVSRVFELELPNGNHTTATLNFFKPEPHPDGDGHRCAYTMDRFFEGQRYASGADSLAALKMAMAHAQAWLWAKNDGTHGKLTWMGTSHLLIFPLGLDDEAPG